MAATRRRAPEARREELLTAAQAVFVRKGVASATVSDIVKAASVAQGTFYLYFDTKDDLVDALAELMVDRLVNEIERSVTGTKARAIDKFQALCDAILSLANDQAGQALAHIYHRPENRAVHDRMAERIAPRLAPLVEQIVRQGVTEGVFATEDHRVAAWFILGGLHLLEVGFPNRADLPDAITHAKACALRALGHRPRTSRARR